MDVSANNLREAGNAAFAKEDYDEAIKMYSEALLVTNISNEEKGLLLSNRSHAYLMSTLKIDDIDEAKLDLALQDANEAMLIRPTWWKGYLRAGLVHQYREEWDHAIRLFGMVLSLDSGRELPKACLKECRFHKILMDKKGDPMMHGFAEEINTTDEICRASFDVECFVKHYETLLECKDPAGRGESCAFFGIRYVKGIDVVQDLPKGIELLTEAVDAGLPEAMVELGILYMEGIGVKLDTEKAVSLFEAAAMSDPKTQNSINAIVRAKFHLGLCCEDGTGKPVDYEQARSWYEQASEGGHAGAANNLAILLDEALGGRRSPARANELYKLSASKGNRVAMETVAWKLLWEQHAKQAQMWYLKAMGLGNEHAIHNKENFRSVLDIIDKSVKGDDSPTSSAVETIVNPENLETPNEANEEKLTDDRQTIVAIQSIASPDIARYWQCYDEVKIRAINGYPFAKKLLTAMNCFAQSLSFFDQLSKNFNQTITSFVEEHCIRNFAECLRANEIIVFLQPSEIPVFFNICEARLNTQTGTPQDLDARIVYCYLLSAQSSDVVPFLRSSLKIYPDEAFFYRMLSDDPDLKTDFHALMQVLHEGLERFPTDDCLLYRKAAAIKDDVQSNNNDEIIAAFEEFIKYAPFDDCMIPEAYYTIAFYTSDYQEEEYYNKGLEAEKNLLPCFLPYPSAMRDLSQTLKRTTVRAKKVEPGIVQIIQRHRAMLKNMSEIKCTADDARTLLNNNPQTQPERPDDFEEIKLESMAKNGDKVYDKRFIDLMICEDPIFGLVRSINVVAADGSKDHIKCILYDLDRYNRTVRQNLAFGSKITILNPYYHVPSDDTAILRVDNPSTVIYNEPGQQNPICRYCWKGNPKLQCIECKRVKYCSKECQVDDWKLLKHKRICGGLKYFDGE